jgi:hypothetical protein
LRDGNDNILKTQIIPDFKDTEVIFWLENDIFPQNDKNKKSKQ